MFINCSNFHPSLMVETISQLILVALKHPVHMLSIGLPETVVPTVDPLLQHLHHIRNVVEFSLFQDSFLHHISVQMNLAMTEEVQDWTEVLGVTIYQERPTLILI